MILSMCYGYRKHFIRNLLNIGRTFKRLIIHQTPMCTQGKELPQKVRQVTLSNWVDYNC